MEKKFLSAAGAQYTEPEKLRELGGLIYEETAIFDILVDFFYHSNIGIRRAAMEVRCATYKICDAVTSLAYSTLYSIFNKH